MKEGFKDKNGKNVWKPKNTLYRLKQSDRTWNKTFHTYLTTQNFVLSPADPCMYVQNIHNQISIILLWVDESFKYWGTLYAINDKTEIKIQNNWSW